MLRSFHRFARDLLLVNNLIKLNVIVILYKESKDPNSKKFNSNNNSIKLDYSYFNRFVLNFSSNEMIKEKLKELVKTKALEAINKKKFMNRSEAEILNKSTISKQKSHYKKIKNPNINIRTISSTQLCEDFFQYIAVKQGSNYFLRDATASTNTKFLREVSKFTNSQVKFSNLGSVGSVSKDKTGNLNKSNQFNQLRKTSNAENGGFKLNMMNMNTTINEMNKTFNNYKHVKNNSQFIIPASNFDPSNTLRNPELNLAGTIEYFTAKKLAAKLNKEDLLSAHTESLIKDNERNNILSKVLAIKLERKKREIDYDIKIKETNRKAKSTFNLKLQKENENNTMFSSKVVDKQKVAFKNFEEELDDSYCSQVDDKDNIIENDEDKKIFNRLNKNNKNNLEFFQRSTKLAQLEVKYSKMLRQRKTINFADFQMKFSSTRREL